MRLLLAKILNFVFFFIRYEWILKFCKKKFDLAIIQEGTIFPCILRIRGTELNLYAELCLAYTK
jgi:hypothetical protein